MRTVAATLTQTTNRYNKRSYAFTFGGIGGLSNGSVALKRSNSTLFFSSLVLQHESMDDLVTLTNRGYFQEHKTHVKVGFCTASTLRNN